MFTEQNNNRVAGSLAGRDINDPITNNYITHQYPNERKTQIGFLYERLKQEVSQKEELQDEKYVVGASSTVVEKTLAIH